VLLFCDSTLIGYSQAYWFAFWVSRIVMWHMTIACWVASWLSRNCCCFAILRLLCITNFGRKPTSEKCLRISSRVHLYRAFSSQVVAVCCSVLQCVAVCYSVLQCDFWEYLPVWAAAAAVSRACLRASAGRVFSKVRISQKTELLESQLATHQRADFLETTTQCALYCHDRVKRLLRKPSMTYIYSQVFLQSRSS